VRRYLKGDAEQVGQLAQRVQGSPDLYHSSGRAPATSINFVTCHDGFTLADLVSFNEKHNEANGEYNRDGGDDNHSWNCGAEGWTEDPSIQELRTRQIKNALAILLTSRGVPMLLMGDEFGRSQRGNNNAYCIDSPISWIDWTLLQTNKSLFDFTQSLVRFRLQHPALRVNHFEGGMNGDVPCCSFHGPTAWQPDWSSESRQLAWMMSAPQHPDDSGLDIVYVATNMAHYASWYQLPSLPPQYRWHLCFNTGVASHSYQPDEPHFHDSGLLVGERSVVIMKAAPS
jgi:glycogen operon protein